MLTDLLLDSGGYVLHKEILPLYLVASYDIERRELGTEIRCELAGVEFTHKYLLELGEHLESVAGKSADEVEMDSGDIHAFSPDFRYG